MSALSGREIRARLLEERIERRLVVSPLLIPEEQCRDDQASIDVRLGFEFALVSPSSSGHVDEFESLQSEQVELTHLYRKIYVRLGESLVIHPHQFILGTTLEYIRLPADLMAYVVGRSTWGRLGLMVATALGVHPGFSGALTLELRNLGETPLRIYPGQVVAQLFFHDVASPAGAGGGIGQYSGSVSVVPKRLSTEKTHAKLKALRERS